jgi:dGTPase
MMDLDERMAAMNALLAPYASRHESRGREKDEPSDGIRMPFQRDRARIIHSTAFRRLAGKTQVFVAGEGDHYRTRLTHTMEVAQITRDLARVLGLNEDLAECIALAHDLGHPPFGHSGQDALDAWMRSRKPEPPTPPGTGSAEGFEHNVQSHRIVTVLETRGGGNGLNLTRDVVDGLLKHGPVPLCLEGQLANACDEIAYTAHDTDDGLHAGLFSYDELRAVPLADRAADAAAERGVQIRGTLIDVLARDLVDHARRTERADGTPAIGLSPDLRAGLRPLRAFLWERMYQHPAIRERMERGMRAVSALCDAYETSPTAPILALRDRTGSSLREAVKDYVSGMTDAFAAREAAALP